MADYFGGFAPNVEIAERSGVGKVPIVPAGQLTLFIGVMSLPLLAVATLSSGDHAPGAAA